MSKIKIYGLVAFACAVGLSFASCGGSGGGAMNPPPPPGGSPTPGVSPTPTVSPFVCPTGGCTSFTLAGTSTQTVTRTAPTPTPPAEIIHSTIGETIAVMPGKVFHGQAATDYQAVETDTGPTQTITTTTDNYLVFPPTTGNVVNIGFHSLDSNGVTLDVQYLSGNGITGQVPCCTGWVNNAHSQINETDPDGTTLSEAINTDGSFTLTKTEVAGTTTETQNSNATGTAQIPVVGFFGAGVGTATKITIPAQSGGTINYTLSAVGVPAPTPAPIVIPVGAWYAPSQTLASDTTTVTGTTAIPAGCVAAPFGPNGLQLHQVESQFDVVFGVEDAETTDTWVTAVGPVCQRISDTVNIFYDFTGQPGFLLLGGPGAIQTNAFSELIGVQAAARADAARHPLDIRNITTSMGIFAGAHSSIDRWRLAIHKKHMLEMLNLLKRGIAK